MRGFQKYARNWILTMAFWATCKIAQPIQPIWQHIFALPWSALKKPPWEFNFFHIFGISSSSRHEKRYQTLQTLFWLFQCSKNPWCTVTCLPSTSIIPMGYRSRRPLLIWGLSSRYKLNLKATFRLLHLKFTGSRIIVISRVTFMKMNGLIETY